MPRHLYGPVRRAFADDHLRAFRARGECLAFGPEPGLDLTVGPADSWEEIRARLPAGWEPDFVALRPDAYLPVPAGLWPAPVPLVALAGDWHLLWHALRLQLPRCELVLSDAAGAETLARQGLGHARPALLYGCGDSWADAAAPDGPRDLDVVFVGSCRSATQGGRLPWLARLAALAGRRRVVIAAGVFGADYRALLGRAKIVFNHAVRGECNQRVWEAVAAGALLFQEAGNREVPRLLADRREFVAYDDANLEGLLDHYLDQEGERRAVAAAARSRLPEFTFARLWGQQLDRIDRALPGLRERAGRRRQAPDELLALRLGQLLHCPAGSDPNLVAALRVAADARPSAAALNALAVALAHGAGGAGAVGEPLGLLRRAAAADPAHPVVGLNLAEALAAAGDVAAAAQQAHRVVGLLDGPGADAAAWDAPPWPAGFDHLRVAWERAAWQHAGDPAAEARAKAELARWRLRALVARHSRRPDDFRAAVRERPDLPPTRAALGLALAHAGRPAEASAELRLALAAAPFDRQTARALYAALGAAADWPGQHRLAHDRLRLHRAAPGLVPAEPWFPDGPTPAADAATLAEGPVGVAWEGNLYALFSMALVNRALAARLSGHGIDLTLLPTDRPGAAPLPPELAGRCHDAPAEGVEVHVRHGWPPDWSPPPSGRWVVYQHWEYGSLPREWLRPLAEQADEVWVMSAYARRCFVQSGVPADRVFVVPGGVDIAALTRPRPPFPLRTQKRFRFLFVGGTLARKGFDVLLAAYALAFRRADDVCLVVKDLGAASFYQGQTAGEAVARLQADPDAPEVEYLDRDLGEDELASLYQSCHCLAYPYRGEGFGLPIAEAMACGLAVIVTGHGAALDFCDEQTAYLVPARERRFAHKRVGDLETVDHPWLAEPDAGVLCRLLRHVVEHPEEARAKGRAAAAYAAAHLTWERAADRVLERLRHLGHRPTRRPGRPAAVAPAPAGPRPRVSLTMIVKNEEQNLPVCLASVADLVDEIVVTDTGSTDQTKEVAAKFGAKVVNFAWQDSFAAARNAALVNATGDWVLWLDADEHLDEQNRGRLRALLERLGRENVGYLMRQHSPLEGPGQAAVVDQVRLFPRHPGLRWRHRVHEQILPGLRELGADVRASGVVVTHTGYTDPALQGPKVERNLRLLLLDHAEHPEEPFTLYNLGAVALTRRRPAEALDWLTRSLRHSRPRDSLLRKLHALLARCRHQLGQPEEALAACRAGLRLYPDDAELLFCEAVVRRARRDLEGAAACLRRLLRAPARVSLSGADALLRGPRAHQQLAEVLQEQGRAAEAEVHWRAALAGCPALAVARLGLARLYLGQGRWDELERVVAGLGGEPRLAAEAALLRGEGLLARREYAAARAALAAAAAARPRAVRPRLLLSRAWLQEGRDPEAAERALRDVLELDPGQPEARHNLDVLLREQGRPAGDVAAGAVARPWVSVTMIVKDEEANLPDCLESIRGLADELIVVDTGSSDRTKEVAARYGAKVYDFQWRDSFAAARNEALRHATGAWVFWLDADDRLDEENRAKLRGLFATLKDEPAAYRMTCLCLAGPDGRETEVDHLRLFRNHPQLRWDYRVHEQVLPAVRRLGHAVRRAGVVVRHAGYRDPAVLARKRDRDLRLLELEARERPADPFVLFNLGQALHHRGRTEQALACFRKSLAGSAPTDSIVRKLYALIAQGLLRLGRTREALAACREGLGRCPDDLELLFEEGALLRGQGDAAGAVACWEWCLRLPPGEYFGSVNPGLRGHVTRHQLALAYRDLGRPADAEAQWRAALAERPDYEPAWRGLAELLNAQERWVEGRELAQQAAGPMGLLFVACLRGRTQLARKNFAEARRRLSDAVERWPRAAEPRALLSHALLQEGQDRPAAEQALRDLIGVHPGNDEARNNLAVLLRRQGRFADGAVPPELTLADLYRRFCRVTSASGEQMSALYLLARQCRRVAVLGAAREGAVTALLFAGPAALTLCGLTRPPEADLVAPLAGQTRFIVQEADALTAAPAETDLLVMSGWRAYDQLQEGLGRHAGTVAQFIVLDGVADFGAPQGAGGYRGPWPAVEEFLARGDFRLRERLGGGSGLTVLERAAPVTDRGHRRQ